MRLARVVGLTPAKTVPMFDDLEIPAFLRRSPDEPSPPWRRLWPEHCLDNATTMSKYEEAAVREIRAQQAEERRIRSQNRIAKMLARKQDHAGETWNSKTARWEKR